MGCVFFPFLLQTFGPFTTSHVAAVPTLFMGIGCVIWTPMSLWLGRRPVLILCAGLMPLATLLGGASTSFGMYIVSIALQGLANGVVFSTVGRFLFPAPLLSGYDVLTPTDLPGSFFILGYAGYY